MDKKKLECSLCKAEFFLDQEAWNRRKSRKNVFCSLGCKSKYHAAKTMEKKHILICSRCNKEFNGQYYQKKSSEKHHAVYCSTECRYDR